MTNALSACRVPTTIVVDASELDSPPAPRAGSARTHARTATMCMHAACARAHVGGQRRGSHTWRSAAARETGVVLAGVKTSNRVGRWYLHQQDAAEGSEGVHGEERE